MNDFAIKKGKPSAEEYLAESLENILRRLNNNPSGNQSEEAFIQSVIMVRAAMLNEEHSKKLNCYTRCIAVFTLFLVIATIALVVVPFIVPSIDKKQLELQLSSQAKLIDSHNVRIEQLTQSLSMFVQDQEILAGKIQATTQPLTRPVSD